MLLLLSAYSCSTCCTLLCRATCREARIVSMNGAAWWHCCSSTYDASRFQKLWPLWNRVTGRILRYVPKKYTSAVCMSLHVYMWLSVRYDLNHSMSPYRTDFYNRNSVIRIKTGVRECADSYMSVCFVVDVIRHREIPVAEIVGNCKKLLTICLFVR